MKTHLIIGILLLLSGSVQGQKYFKCIEKQQGTSMVFETLAPLFKRDTLDKTNMRSIAAHFKSIYRDSLFNKTLESILPKDSIEKLEFYKHSSERRMAKTLIIFTIDNKGKIWEINFFISVKDKAILTDEVLYKIYQKFNETRVDMNKMNMEFFNVSNELYINQAYPIYWYPIKDGKE